MWRKPGLRDSERKEFAALMRKLEWTRLRLGMTKGKVCAELGVAEGMLRAWSSGRTIGRKESVAKIKDWSGEMTPKAIVEDCHLDASAQVTPDVQVAYYRVEARMLVPRNSGDSYMVRIIKPEGLGHLVHEKGELMEHGKFSFGSTEDVPKGTELELQISPIEP
jgi:hypothetical protein